MVAPDSDNCAPYLKALADKTRWHIVRGFFSSAPSVSELAKTREISQHNASKHIRVPRAKPV